MTSLYFDSIIASSNYHLKSLYNELDYITMEYVENILKSDYKILCESGTTDDLEFLYEEAKKEATEKSKGILGRIIDGIKAIFRKIKEIFTGKASDNNDEEDMPEEITLPEDPDKLVENGESVLNKIVSWISGNQEVLAAVGAAVAGTGAVVIKKSAIKNKIETVNKFTDKAYGTLDDAKKRLEQKEAIMSPNEVNGVRHLLGLLHIYANRAVQIGKTIFTNEDYKDAKRKAKEEKKKAAQQKADEQQAKSDAQDTIDDTAKKDNAQTQEHLNAEQYKKLYTKMDELKKKKASAESQLKKLNRDAKSSVLRIVQTSTKAKDLRSRDAERRRFSSLEKIKSKRLLNPKEDEEYRRLKKAVSADNSTRNVNIEDLKKKISQYTTDIKELDDILHDRAKASDRWLNDQIDVTQREAQRSKNADNRIERQSQQSNT